MDLGVEPRRRLDRRTRHLPAASCIPPGLQPSRPCPAAGRGWLGRESEAGSAQTSFTLNKIQRLSSIIFHPFSLIISSPVAIGERRSDRCGLHWKS